MKAWLVWFVAVAVLLLVGAVVEGGTENAGPPPVQVPEIPEEWESEADEIIGRYLLFRDLLNIVYANHEMNPFDVPLEKLTTVDYFLHAHRQISVSRRLGFYIVIPEGSRESHRVTLNRSQDLSKVEGNTVTLLDCWIQDAIFEDTRADGTFRALEADLFAPEMTVSDGQWRIARIPEASASLERQHQMCKRRL